MCILQRGGCPRGKPDYIRSPKKQEGAFLTIYGDTVDEGDHMFEQDMYLSIFHCLCYIRQILIDMLEEQKREEGEIDLEIEEDIMISYD